MLTYQRLDFYSTIQRSQGQELVILEAMKMEHVIAAPSAGTVDMTHFIEGDLVDEGAVLVTLRPPASEDS